MRRSRLSSHRPARHSRKRPTQSCSGRGAEAGHAPSGPGDLLASLLADRGCGVERGWHRHLHDCADLVSCVDRLTDADPQQAVAAVDKLGAEIRRDAMAVRHVDVIALGGILAVGIRARLAQLRVTRHAFRRASRIVALLVHVAAAGLDHR
jgi:hypothetical protein